MFTFKFTNGVAQIVETLEDNTEKVIIHQPFMPTFGDPVSWDSEEQAETWMKREYPGYFN